VVESRAFSKRLEEAVARYHSNAISATEMIEELISLAKDLQAARKRGEELGLTEEEIAFYDALAQNESAIQALGNDTLRIIAHELLEQLRENATVDWHKRESTRARMRRRSVLAPGDWLVDERSDDGAARHRCPGDGDLATGQT